MVFPAVGLLDFHLFLSDYPMSCFDALMDGKFGDPGKCSWERIFTGEHFFSISGNGDVLGLQYAGRSWQRVLVQCSEFSGPERRQNSPGNGRNSPGRKTVGVHPPLISV